MNAFLQTYIQLDGYIFLFIGLIVLIFPSPQPALATKVNPGDLVPFLQTRRLLASMFIASAVLLIIIGRNIFDPGILKQISVMRIISFALVVGLNIEQYRSKRWKPGPLVVLISVFSIMSLIYVYLILR